MNCRNPFILLGKINRYLIQIFYSLGYNVGLHPFYYIIIPSIISLALSSGLLFIKFEEDPMVLFVPYTAPFLKEQKIVQHYFPMNYTHFYDPLRFIKHEGHSRVIISARDDKSILRPELWPEIMELSRNILNIYVVDDGVTLNYTGLCAKWLDECMENSALNINQIIDDVANGSTIINYPLMLFPLILPQLLGGITVDESAGKVDDAKALLLGYFLDIDSPHKIQRAWDWELQLLNYLHTVNFKHIKISYYTSRSIFDELKTKMDSCLPYIPLTTLIMLSSCVALLWTSDCIRSKPLIGGVGITSTGMAAGSSFGFLIYCGATYTRLNVVTLFLILGIGVDDIFVAIAAWQKTSVNDPVPKRLAQTYADAAVSVTITSLTNALAFAVGTTTPTLIVQYFCLYCAVTIIFAYLFFITFCGGFLALAGMLEQQGRHSLFLIKVQDPPEDASAFKKKFYALFCSSASLQADPNTQIEQKPHIVSVFFRDTVGPLLMNSKFRVLVLISLILYLIGAIYGCIILKEGLYRHRMSRDDSYLVAFSHEDNRYFRHLPYALQVLILGNVTYSDPQTQQDLIALEKKFEALPHGGNSIFTQSWLRSFLRLSRRKKDWKARMKDEPGFIKVLREEYFNPDNVHALDVKFNENFTRIVASRMIFQTKNVKDVFDDVVMMNSFREVASDSKYNVTVFHLLFSLFDQHTMMRPLAIQSILIAVALVMVIGPFFIPDAWGSIALACSIFSTAIGVIGYMAFWDVNLDHVSAGSIFMCIGFSVDFSAHITYTYLSSKATTPEGKIKESLFCLALPILQGGLSTILCLVTFLLIPGYGYRTFFKTIFLVTIFAAYHSIILIPLFLAIVESGSDKYKRRNSRNSVTSAIRNSSRILHIANGSAKANTLTFPPDPMSNGTYVKTDTEITITDSPKKDHEEKYDGVSDDVKRQVIKTFPDDSTDSLNSDDGSQESRDKDSGITSNDFGIENKAFDDEEEK